MTVALDATPLTVPTGGVKRYTEELSRALAEEFPGDRFCLISDQPFERPNGPANLMRGEGPQTPAERRWWSWGVQRELRRTGADLFHGTDFSVPYWGRRPSVMTLHDLSPWRDPAWHSDAARVRRRTPWLLRLGRVDLLLTPSEAIRREAADHFRIPRDRIVATPLAPARGFHPVSVAPPAVPYFLYVGTLEPRKNVPLLVEAWREVKRRRPVELLLAGRTRPDFATLPAEPGLRLLGPVPDEDLPALYGGATASLYPSLYEGFGLPVIEAMQCGAAVITSRDPAVVEAGGDAALALDAHDVRAWAEAMESLLEQPERARAMRDESRRVAAQYSWARTAHLTYAAYQEARRRVGR